MKSSSGSRKTQAWREFEQLVAQIEQQLAPGAVVRCPDRIRDLVTGRLREVDASIRLPVGSASVLVTIECRKRRGVQDDTWIEQLATKKAKIGAAMTIAVSAKGFSPSAKKTAALHEIELRQLVDRAAEEIVRELLAGIQVTVTVGSYQVIGVGFSVPDEVMPQKEFEALLTPLVEQRGFVTVADDVMRTAGVTFRELVGAFDTVEAPVDGPPLTKIFPAHLPQIVSVPSPAGNVPVSELQFHVQFTRRKLPAAAAKFHEYSSPDGVIRRMIEAKPLRRTVRTGGFTLSWKLLRWARLLTISRGLTRA